MGGRRFATPGFCAPSPWTEVHGYRHGLALRGRTGRAQLVCSANLTLGKAGLGSKRAKAPIRYAKSDFTASTQDRGYLSRVHADRVARGDRDYCDTRRPVASGFEQGQGISQEHQLHEQPSSNWTRFRHLLSGPEWPSSVVPKLAFYKIGRSD